MDDLLQSQIKDSCKLALPEGLKDLMYDISREVLRAQPKDLYCFITDYLSALMVVRENLRVAAHVCNFMCDDVCHLKLEDQFKKLGLETEEAVKTAELVKEYFDKGVVNECNLITMLMNETTLNEQYLPQIQSVIRNAFLQHHAYAATGSSESTSNSEIDDVTRATRHTLHLYKQSKPTHEEYVRAAVTIQAAYRAYKVRRNVRLRDRVSKEYRLTVESEHFAEFYERVHNAPEHSTTFLNVLDCSINFERKQSTQNEILPLHPSGETTHIGQPYISTASSTSLAGSFLNLPKYKPYNAHSAHLKEILSGLEELPEQEHATIDYTQDHPQRVFTKQSKDDDDDDIENKKTIKFQVQTLEVIEDEMIEDETVEDETVEDLAKDAVDSHDESLEEVNEIHDLRGSGEETD